MMLWWVMEVCVWRWLTFSPNIDTGYSLCHPIATLHRHCALLMLGHSILGQDAYVVVACFLTTLQVSCYVWVPFSQPLPVSTFPLVYPHVHTHMWNATPSLFCWQLPTHTLHYRRRLVRARRLTLATKRVWQRARARRRLFICMMDRSGCASR